MRSKDIRKILRKHMAGFTDRDYRMWMESLRLKAISRFLKMNRRTKTEFGVYGLLKHQPVYSAKIPTCTCGMTFHDEEQLMDHRIDECLLELRRVKNFA